MMSAKRVVFLHHRLDMGGIDRVACLLAEGFAAAGYRVDMLVFCKGGSGEKSLLPLLSGKVNLSYLAASGTERTKDLLSLLPKCANWICQNRPDCVISTSNNMNWLTSAAAKLSRTRAKVVLKTTNPIVREQDRGIYAKLRKFGYYWAIKCSDRMLALSNAETQILKQQFGSLGSKFQTVTNPYVTPEMLTSPTSNSSATGRYNSNKRMILGIGRFEPQKRFDLLIKAFAALTLPDVDLVILGDGSQKQDCEKLVAQLKLQGRVHMPGFVSDVTPWLHQAEMLIMTSQYEGLPAVILEALAANCPVLTTDCFPAAREIIEPLSGCEIIESRVPNHIAQLIESTLSQPASDALHLGAQKYSVENGIRDHVSQIRDLLQSPTGCGPSSFAPSN